MRIVGNINQIKQKRDSENRDVEVHLDKIEYITHKKDGKYDQPFDYIDELETPLVITGDCLARSSSPTSHLEEGESEFYVFRKTGDAYEKDENSLLTLTMTYDFDANVNILTASTYTVTLSNEAFQQLKSDRAKARRKKNSRKNR
ncbi:hypothetical protein MKJ04_04945 [Pontibacter sp. E15-1]|uniref:hypothetical protein n=1 Tax=Pontibacter sp. E15-1 TaxID=2919918 RepID=UPI001F4F7A11|nr:hypothetical protein [Pontibacter sp. E15-1]MCJ8164179.1 hypothetical protein [Pontibacter sp. E15-1]